MTGEGEDDLLPKIRGQVLRAVYESDLVVFLVDSRDGVLPSTRRSPGCCASGEAGPARREQGRREGGQGRRFPVPRPLRRHDPSRFGRTRHGGLRPARRDRRADSRPVRRRGGDGRSGRRPSEDRRGGAAERGKVDARQHAGGFERVIASEVPAPRATPSTSGGADGRNYLLIDTAGIRAKRKTEGRSKSSRDEEPRLDQAVRPRDPPDRRSRGLTTRTGRSCATSSTRSAAVVVAANKADAWTTEEARRKGLHAIAEGLDYASFAPVVPTVATSEKDSSNSSGRSRRPARTSACASRPAR